MISNGYISRLPKRAKHKQPLEEQLEEAQPDRCDETVAGEGGEGEGGAAAAVPVKRAKKAKWRPEEDEVLREQYALYCNSEDCARTREPNPPTWRDP